LDSSKEEVVAADVRVQDERVVALPGKVSWGAIFAGAVAALGIWILLYTFGLAVGLSTIDPQSSGSLKGSGLFTGIWSIVSPLVALFVGGMVAGRGAGTQTRASGGVHGLVVWGLTAILGAYLVANLLGSVVSGVASAGKAAVGLGAQVASGGADQAKAFGLDADDALKPVNQRLEAEGKPPVTADQLKAAVGQSMQQAITTGNLDRNTLTQSIAQSTSLSQQDAEELSGRVESQFQEWKGQASAQLDKAKTSAMQAADTTGKAFFGVFGALLLGLVSAVLGAMAGVPRHHRILGEREVIRTAPGYRESEIRP
jgi:hypothetical protein